MRFGTQKEIDIQLRGDVFRQLEMGARDRPSRAPLDRSRLTVMTVQSGIDTSQWSGRRSSHAAAKTESL
jgi:hypothetical protein